MARVKIIKVYHNYHNDYSDYAQALVGDTEGWSEMSEEDANALNELFNQSAYLRLPFYYIAIIEVPKESANELPTVESLLSEARSFRQEKLDRIRKQQESYKKKSEAIAQRKKAKELKLLESLAAKHGQTIKGIE